MRYSVIGSAVLVAVVVLAGAPLSPPAAAAGETQTTATDADNAIVAYYFPSTICHSFDSFLHFHYNHQH